MWPRLFFRSRMRLGREMTLSASRTVGDVGLRPAGADHSASSCSRSRFEVRGSGVRPRPSLFGDGCGSSAAAGVDDASVGGLGLASSLSLSMRWRRRSSGSIGGGGGAAGTCGCDLVAVVAAASWRQLAERFLLGGECRGAARPRWPGCRPGRLRAPSPRSLRLADLGAARRPRCASTCVETIAVTADLGHAARPSASFAASSLAPRRWDSMAYSARSLSRSV